MATELKELPLETTQFEANGVMYFVKVPLSIERFKWYEKYGINFGFGRSFESICKLLIRAKELADKGKGLDAWHIILDLIDVLQKELDKRSHAAFYLCSLFICEENEDLTAWDESLAEIKIANWNKEGISANSFFRLAANLVSGFLDALEAHSQDISAVTDLMKPLEGLMKQD